MRVFLKSNRLNFNTYAPYLKYYYKDIERLDIYARNDAIFAP